MGDAADVQVVDLVEEEEDNDSEFEVGQQHPSSKHVQEEQVEDVFQQAAGLMAIAEKVFEITGGSQTASGGEEDEVASTSSDGYEAVLAVYTSDEEVERDVEEDTEAHFEQRSPSSFNARLVMSSQDGTSQASVAVHSRNWPATQPSNQQCKQRRRTATRDVQQAIVSAGTAGCMRQAEGL